MSTNYKESRMTAYEQMSSHAWHGEDFKVRLVANQLFNFVLICDQVGIKELKEHEA